MSAFQFQRKLTHRACTLGTFAKPSSLPFRDNSIYTDFAELLREPTVGLIITLFSCKVVLPSANAWCVKRSRARVTNSLPMLAVNPTFTPCHPWNLNMPLSHGVVPNISLPSCPPCRLSLWPWRKDRLTWSVALIPIPRGFPVFRAPPSSCGAFHRVEAPFWDLQLLRILVLDKLLTTPHATHRNNKLPLVF